MNAPKVSVIMATYNGAALIGRRSTSLLAQSFTDWELVAVDDCSKRRQRRGAARPIAIRASA
jgi:glycosyltransferase involved in cell wall biosynthesis